MNSSPERDAVIIKTPEQQERLTVLSTGNGLDRMKVLLLIGPFHWTKCWNNTTMRTFISPTEEFGSTFKSSRLWKMKEAEERSNPRETFKDLIFAAAWFITMTTTASKGIFIKVSVWLWRSKLKDQTQNQHLTWNVSVFFYQQEETWDSQSQSSHESVWNRNSSHSSEIRPILPLSLPLLLLHLDFPPFTSDLSLTKHTEVTGRKRAEGGVAETWTLIVLSRCSDHNIRSGWNWKHKYAKYFKYFLMNSVFLRRPLQSGLLTVLWAARWSSAGSSHLSMTVQVTPETPTTTAHPHPRTGSLGESEDGGKWLQWDPQTLHVAAGVKQHHQSPGRHERFS